MLEQEVIHECSVTTQKVVVCTSARANGKSTLPLLSLLTGHVRRSSFASSSLHHLF